MNHDSYDNAYISGILNSVRTIAIVGASANDVRPSFFVTKYLIDKGFDVFPINPGHAGQGNSRPRRVYARLADVPVPIDMVDIFRASNGVPPIVEDALRLDPLPKVIWMQLTVRNDAAAAKAEACRRQGGHESLPEDRIRPPFGRDRLERRQFRRAVVEKADHAAGFPELRRSAEVEEKKFRRCLSLPFAESAACRKAEFSSLQSAPSLAKNARRV